MIKTLKYVLFGGINCLLIWILWSIGLMDTINPFEKELAKLAETIIEWILILAIGVIIFIKLVGASCLSFMYLDRVKKSTWIAYLCTWALIFVSVFGDRMVLSGYISMLWSSIDNFGIGSLIIWFFSCIWVPLLVVVVNYILYLVIKGIWYFGEAAAAKADEKRRIAKQEQIKQEQQRIETAERQKKEALIKEMKEYVITQTIEHTEVVNTYIDKAIENSKVVIKKDLNIEKTTGILLDVRNGVKSTKQFDRYLDNDDSYSYYKRILGDLEKKYLLSEAKDKAEELVNQLIKESSQGLGEMIHPYLQIDMLTAEEKRKISMIRKNTNIVLGTYGAYLSSRVKELYKQYTILDLGMQGELLVNEQLKLFSDSIISLKSVRIKVDNEYSENDNIIICNKGIFAIEVKNYGAGNQYKLHIEKDGRWSKISNKDEKIEYLDINPAEQNTRHVAHLERVINRALGRSMGERISAKGIVVIANNQVTIINESTQPVVRSGQLYNTIMDYPNSLTTEEIESIVEAIEASQVALQKYKYIDLEKELEINKQYINHYVHGIVEQLVQGFPHSEERKAIIEEGKAHFNLPQLNIETIL